ncbi:hypothetical protein C8R44DRAFT_710010 [Mycena epipterygia]|nr:hypothetical protein C8R44DRAFT_710010 [Mycena epipterygia]
MSQADSQQDPQRAENLWFADADLVLRAENTLFRVYSGILAARSSVFSDMATFPQPHDSEGPTVDGRPVVPLHDSAAEVEMFLTAVFDSSFFMPPPSPTNFATVIGIMRLAHKYDVPYLFRRALSHLDSIYPSDFSRFLHVTYDNAEHHIDFVGGDATEDLIALRAVSQVGARWFLPVIYYSICTFPAKELLAAAHWRAIGADGHQTCLMAQPELVRATALTHEFLLEIPTCDSAEHCRSLFQEGRDTLLDWSRSGGCDLDPLSGWVLDDESELCQVCLKDAKASYSAARLAFWDRLPGVFGLPGWEELKQMRLGIMGE